MTNTNTMETQIQCQRQSLYLPIQLAPLCDPYGTHQRWVMILSLDDRGDSDIDDEGGEDENEYGC